MPPQMCGLVRRLEHRRASRKWLTNTQEVQVDHGWVVPRAGGPQAPAVVPKCWSAGLHALKGVTVQCPAAAQVVADAHQGRSGGSSLSSTLPAFHPLQRAAELPKQALL
jgi:hypothetical protein